MGIVRAATFAEAYRARAGAKDINELSGRANRPDLTAFVTGEIVGQLPLRPDAVLVDIGCGDGLLLLKAAENGVDGYVGRLIGILPSVEEVSRVRDHLLRGPEKIKHLISIELGRAQNTGIPNEFSDVLVCNSVLLGLAAKDVSVVMAEFHRISKAGGTIFIGEIPDTDEFSGKHFGSSLAGLLMWVLKNQGMRSVLVWLRRIVRALLAGEPFVISPPNPFFMAPQDFITLLQKHGIHVIRHYRHRETDTQGNVYESKTRWNYVAVKTPG